MKKILLSIAFFTLAGCSSTSGVLPVGGGNYVITSESEFSAADMHKNALVEANEFCTSQNKELDVLKTQSGRGGTGAFGPKIVFSMTFRCK